MLVAATKGCVQPSDDRVRPSPEAMSGAVLGRQWVTSMVSMAFLHARAGLRRPSDAVRNLKGSLDRQATRI